MYLPTVCAHHSERDCTTEKGGRSGRGIFQRGTRDTVTVWYHWRGQSLTVKWRPLLIGRFSWRGEDATRNARHQPGVLLVPQIDPHRLRYPQNGTFELLHLVCGASSLANRRICTAAELMV